MWQNSGELDVVGQYYSRFRVLWPLSSLTGLRAVLLHKVISTLPVTAGSCLLREPSNFSARARMNWHIFSCPICGWVIYDEEESVSWMNQFRGCKYPP